MSSGPLFVRLLGYVHGRAGNRAEALRMIETLTGMASRGHVSPVDFAIIHAGLGDADSVFLWMERAYQQRETRIAELSTPHFDQFRSDARYASLMKRIGLPL